MTFKEFVKKIFKLKQENPEISNCIDENYYLMSINDKEDRRFKPCLFFYIKGEGQFPLGGVYDLTVYKDREVKEIRYSEELGHNIVFIEEKVEDLED